MLRGQVPACNPDRRRTFPLRAGRRTILLLTILTSAWTGLVPTVHAARIVRSLSFDRSQVRLAPGPRGLEIAIEGGTPFNQPGRPLLPGVAAFIAIPDGEHVVRTEVRATGGTIDLGPADGVTPGAVPSGAVAPVFDGGLYPGRAGDFGPLMSLRGAPLLPVVVWPVAVNPATGRLELRTSVEIEVTTASGGDEGRWRTQRTVDAAQADFLEPLRERILNPELLERTAAPRDRALRPLDGGATPFSPRFRPSVDGSPVDYVIITSDALLPQFAPLAEWKTRSGVSAVVRSVEWIRANYPNGVDLGETIRRFIADAASRWGTRFVLLAGDTEIIPARFGRTAYFGGENIPADMYYQCLDGNWNADGDALFGEGYSDAVITGDGCDLMPDVFLGRASIVDSAGAATFVSKVLTYEKSPPLTGGYPMNALFFAEVLFPQHYAVGDSIIYDGALLAEAALSYFPAPYARTRLYENYPAYAAQGALPEAKATVIDHINTGYGFVQHVGHGYINTMTVGIGGQALDNNDAAAFLNVGKAGILYAINCTSAAIDYNCLGEQWLLNPNGGAVADVGSTRFDFPATGVNFQNEFYRVIFSVGARTLGEAFAWSKTPYVPLSVYDSEVRWTQFAQILLGDPSMTIWTDTPQPLSVSHPSALTLGSSTVTVQVQRLGVPVDSARVCLWKPDDDYEWAWTDSLGVAQFAFRPDHAGAAFLTVVARNGLPYEATLPVTAPAAPHLFAIDTVVLDSGSGTTGNGDGIFDANETVKLNLVVKNEGTLAATGITATLSSLDAALQVTDASGTYPDIVVGQSATPGNTMLVKAVGTATDRFEARVNLTLSANGGAYVRTEPVVVYVGAPLLERFQISITDVGVGNGNGIIEQNEDQLLTCRVRNNGRGTVRTLLGKLRALDAQTVIADSVSTYGDVGPDQLVDGDTFLFRFTDTNLHSIRLVLESNKKGILIGDIDVVRPATPGTPNLSGKASSIQLTWTPVADTDAKGYVIYRSLTAGGPYTRVNAYADNRIAYYDDTGLAALTRYYYRVSTLDISGNESPMSPEATATTTLPLAFGFPVPLGGATSSSPGLSYFNGDSIPEIVCASNEIYVMSGNGLEVLDGDGDARTYGVFSKTFGATFWSPPSSADIDRDGVIDVAAATWSGGQLYLFDGHSDAKPGWPVDVNLSNSGTPRIWSAPGLADVDGDNRLEIFINGDNRTYAYHYDGTELLDGDANPATPGVFATLGTGANYATPVIVDMDNDSVPEVIIASRDRNLYVKTLAGANYPGFPFLCAGDITTTPAIADLNNDGLKEMVWGSSDNKIHAMNINKVSLPGFPKGQNFNQDLDSSAAIADMNGDGFLDIVSCSGNGSAYIYSGATGNLLPGFPQTFYDPAGNRIQIRSSPVVGNIDLTPDLEMIFGGQDGNVYAVKSNGQPALGFPIKTGNVIEGAPMVWDLDHDGLTEVCVQGFDQLLYLWDTPAAFTPSSCPWPMFAHDGRRTSVYGSPQFIVTGVAEGGRPPTAELLQNAPNPFSPRTRLRYRVGGTAGQPVTLDVFDLGGRLVRRLDEGVREPGAYETAWDGRRDDGGDAPSGVYFARLRVGSDLLQRKMVLTR